MARITFPRTRALVAGVLFVSWIGFLAYLVSITRNTIPLAGPQIQTADVVILADVKDDLGRAASEVLVKEVLSAAAPGQIVAGAKVTVDDLLFCGRLNGYRGEGSYVIPLKRVDPGSTYRVKMLPIVPGYYAPTSECEVDWGIDKESVAKALARETGAPAARIERLFEAKAALKERGIVVPNLPFYFTATKEFQDRIAKAGGKVRIPAEPGESRIYRATPQVLEEVRALLR
jgi:hypothetical protein